MLVKLAIAMIAMFYHIDIPEIIVWTIIITCNASYVLPRVYNELLLLSYRYAWDNKPVLLLYFSHAYNHITTQYTYTKCNVKRKQTSILKNEFKKE